MVRLCLAGSSQRQLQCVFQHFIAEHSFHRCVAAERQLNGASFFVHHVAVDRSGAIQNFLIHLLLRIFGFCGGVGAVTEDQLNLLLGVVTLVCGIIMIWRKYFGIDRVCPFCEKRTPDDKPVCKHCGKDLPPQVLNKPV